MKVTMAVDRILIKLIVFIIPLKLIHCQDSVPSCQGAGGISCSGNGICFDGICYCYPGHGGALCDIDDADILDEEFASSTTTVSTLDVDFNASTTTGASFDNVSTQCPVSNGQVCNGHGQCVEGFCVCDVNWDGEACEITRRSGFCNAYQRCAECTAFGLKCAENCNATAGFRLVEELPSSASDYIFHRCRYRSSLHHCSFFYQLGKETVSGKKVILVKTCPDWLISLKGVGAETTQGPNMTGLSTGLTWSVIVPVKVTSPIITPLSPEEGDEDNDKTGKDDLPGSAHKMTICVWYLFLCLFLSELFLWH